MKSAVWLRRQGAVVVLRKIRCCTDLVKSKVTRDLYTASRLLHRYCVLMEDCTREAMALVEAVACGNIFQASCRENGLSDVSSTQRHCLLLFS